MSSFQWLRKEKYCTVDEQVIFYITLGAHSALNQSIHLKVSHELLYYMQFTCGRKNIFVCVTFHDRRSLSLSSFSTVFSFSFDFVLCLSRPNQARTGMNHVVYWDACASIRQIRWKPTCCLLFMIGQLLFSGPEVFLV